MGCFETPTWLFLYVGTIGMMGMTPPVPPVIEALAANPKRTFEVSHRGLYGHGTFLNPYYGHIG